MKLTARDNFQLGHAIRYQRKQSGLTQKQLAKLAGVRQPTISDIENGKRSFTDILFRILNALEVELVFQKLDMGGRVFDPEEFYNG